MIILRVAFEVVAVAIVNVSVVFAVVIAVAVVAVVVFTAAEWSFLLAFLFQLFCWCSLGGLSL